MAYDSVLAERLRDQLSGRSDVAEKKMFGGIAFMVSGNMCVGVIRDELCARVGTEAFAEAVKRTGARPMDFTKRPMKGWLFVAPEGLESDEVLGSWVRLCLDFVATLPPK